MILRLAWSDLPGAPSAPPDADLAANQFLPLKIDAWECFQKIPPSTQWPQRRPRWLGFNLVTCRDTGKLQDAVGTDFMAVHCGSGYFWVTFWNNVVPTYLEGA